MRELIKEIWSTSKRNSQLRTRVQAFVESLEIKQLQAQRGGK